MSFLRIAALGVIAAACLVVIYLGHDTSERPDMPLPPAMPAQAPIAVVPLPAPKPLALEHPKVAKPAPKVADAAIPEPPLYSCAQVRTAASLFSPAQLDALAEINHTTSKQKTAALRCLKQSPTN